jgi:hypothetical protein
VKGFRRVLLLTAFTTMSAAVPASMAGASPGNQQNPTTGQPGTSAGFNCTQTGATVEPGNAANAPGSAFNENGGTAGSVYAGSGASLNHAGSTAAVSQYDTACRRLTSH